jgi:hypothetical protein
MLESEAKTKWCPAHKIIIEGLDASQKCIGSACMAWRWEKVNILRDKKTGVFSSLPPSWDGSQYEMVEADHPSKGFCGLAGRP